MPRKSSTQSALSTEPAPGRRIYVLDTNVLMHDPASIFRFEEHDIYLPMVVLEELDHNKKGVSEPARNVRQVSRFLDEIMQGADKADIDEELIDQVAAQRVPFLGSAFDHLVERGLQSS